MGAYLMGGGGGNAALGEEDHLEKKLRIRIKCSKIGERNEAVGQEAASPDVGSGRASGGDGGGVRAHQFPRSGDGEFVGDQDATDESENPHLGDHDESPLEAEEAMADNEVDGSSSSSKHSHAHKGASEIPTCPECGKTFPSDKSLFGHLRCHPERDYRGANPPPNARKKPPPHANSPATARELSATKWVTARRGRKVTASDDNDLEATAASTLLLLANAKLQDPETKQILDTHLDDADGLGWHQNTTDIDADKYESELMSNYKRIKKRKLKELELVNECSGTSTRGRRYQCSLCPKTFSSHQALGGHRASHNKNKSSPEEVATMNGENERADLKHGEELVHSSSALTKVAITEHRCKNCNQTFATGQALGGHQRRHFNEQQNRAPSSPAQSCGGDKVANHGAPSSSAQSSESDKGAKHERFDFDLNEVPRLE